MADMIFAEWLYQDLRRVTKLHAGLLRLDALAARRGWGPAVVAEIKEAFDLDGAHAVPIVSIRPEEPLPGTMFSGFTDPALRRTYVRLGRARATEVLDAIGWRWLGEGGLSPGGARTAEHLGPAPWSRPRRCSAARCR